MDREDEDRTDRCVADRAEARAIGRRIAERDAELMERLAR